MMLLLIILCSYILFTFIYWLCFLWVTDENSFKNYWSSYTDYKKYISKMQDNLTWNDYRGCITDKNKEYSEPRIKITRVCIVFNDDGMYLDYFSYIAFRWHYLRLKKNLKKINKVNNLPIWKRQ